MRKLRFYLRHRKDFRFCSECYAHCGKRITERQLRKHKLTEHGVVCTPGY